MNFPDNLKYTKDHVWVKKDGDTAKIGITDYAQDQLGDILFVDLPAVGDTLTAGETFTEVESSKTASEIPAPVSGEVIAVNDVLDDTPEAINENAYDAWIVEVKTDDDLSGLISASDYEGGLE
ncbi:MAG: glycine cleavage system protein GcvH [Lachnospiraceae bacterium]|nr:glycine cleavage system protein GcvH [Lachnospiraceae bacterium]